MIYSTFIATEFIIKIRPNVPLQSVGKLGDEFARIFDLQRIIGSFATKYFVFFKKSLQFIMCVGN